MSTDIPADERAFQTYQAWRDGQYALRDKGRNGRAVTEATALVTKLGGPLKERSSQTTLGLGKAVHTALRNGAQTGKRIFIPSLRDCMTAAEREDAEDMVRNILATPSMARAQAAKERFAEVPFSLQYKKSVDGANCLLEGVIDFAFVEDNAWVVLGFKTGTILHKDTPLQIQRERLQLGVHALALEELTAYPVKDLIVMLARSSKDLSFTWNEAARSDAQAFLQGEQKK